MLKDILRFMVGASVLGVLGYIFAPSILKKIDEKNENYTSKYKEYKYQVLDSQRWIPGYTNDITVVEGCILTNNGKTCGSFSTKLYEDYNGTK